MHQLVVVAVRTAQWSRLPETYCLQPMRFDTQFNQKLAYGLGSLCGEGSCDLIRCFEPTVALQLQDTRCCQQEHTP